VVLSELTFDILSNDFDLLQFDCGDKDINAFLKDDALNYQREKLATTYIFHLDKKPIAYFSILNDCLHDKGYEANTWNRFHRKHKIPNNKRIRQYPAVKIGRLGVEQTQQGSGLAYELMDFIKGFTLFNHKPACRLLLLDAYNKPQQQKYYLRNDFQFLDNSSTQDVTRLMYFDLIQLS
jgi:hypothetical protein